MNSTYYTSATPDSGVPPQYRRRGTSSQRHVDVPSIPPIANPSFSSTQSYSPYGMPSNNGFYEAPFPPAPTAYSPPQHSYPSGFLTNPMPAEEYIYPSYPAIGSTQPYAAANDLSDFRLTDSNTFHEQSAGLQQDWQTTNENELGPPYGPDQTGSQMYPYVLPLHPYGSDSFLSDELSTGPPPPRSAFRRRSSESSLSNGATAQDFNTNNSFQSAFTNPLPSDSFGTLPPLDFTSSSNVPPVSANGGSDASQHRRHQAPTSSARSRRYLGPPGPLETLIGGSGMLQDSLTPTHLSSSGMPVFPPLSQDLRHVCQVCGRGFGRPSALTTHSLSHTGEQPHTCHVCGRGFSVASNLRRHLRLHTDVELQDGPARR